jgi:hypothetical protein
VIVQWFLAAVFGVLEFFIGLLPGWEWPDWLVGSGSGTLAGFAASLAGGMGDVSSWLPISIVGGCITAIGGALLFAVAVRIVRMVLSFLSGGGGGAA